MRNRSARRELELARRGFASGEDASEIKKRPSAELVGIASAVPTVLGLPSRDFAVGGVPSEYRALPPCDVEPPIREPVRNAASAVSWASSETIAFFRSARSSRDATASSTSPRLSGEASAAGMSPEESRRRLARPGYLRVHAAAPRSGTSKAKIRRVSFKQLVENGVVHLSRDEEKSSRGLATRRARAQAARLAGAKPVGSGGERKQQTTTSV